MTRLMFLIAWLLGPRKPSGPSLCCRYKLFLFYCLVGGLATAFPASPYHAVKSLYPPMPKPNPVPPNTAEVLRKRMNSGPRMSN